MFLTLVFSVGVGVGVALSVISIAWILRSMRRRKSAHPRRGIQLDLWPYDARVGSWRN